MRIIARGTLKLFWERYVDTEHALKTWYQIVHNAKWTKFSDIKEVFRSADIISNDRVVFNIKGNHYRLIVKIKYEFQIVYIRFVGLIQNMTQYRCKKYIEVVMLKIKPIKSKIDYQEALRAIDALWEGKLNSAEGDNLEILITLVEKYESEHFKIEAPDPIEAIKFMIEQKNIKRLELEKILGSKSRVSEVLNKQRKLNLRMIRKLHSSLKIPYEVLVEDYTMHRDVR